MYIKRYEASSLTQAVELVRKELGSDAVILSTRSLRPTGFFPWFRKPVFEVIAARDTEGGGTAQTAVPSEASRSMSMPSSSRQSRRPPLDVIVGGRRDETQMTRQVIEGTLAAVPMPSAVPQEALPVTDASSDIKAAIAPVLEEIGKIKTQIAELSAASASATAVNPVPVQAAAVLSQAAPTVPVQTAPMQSQAAPTVPVQATTAFPPAAPRAGNTLAAQEESPLSGVMKTLIDRGLTRASAELVVKRMETLYNRHDYSDAVRGYSLSRDAIAGLLAEGRRWGDIKGDGPRIIALVGPTGVGKTTTVAKLAARYSLMRNLNVALIAADTYRIAAVSQLRMYGELLGVEVDVVHGPDEVGVVIENRMNKDVVLIDTAGRSPMSQVGLDGLRRLLDAAKPSQIHLVMSATTRYADIIDIMDRFSLLPIDSLIFSKIDESIRHSDIVETLLETKLGVSYICTGQGVPNDIEEAAPIRISELLLPDLARA